MTESLIFPYSVHPFDIAKNYEKPWFYIKLIYCINLFITNYLIINSIFTYFKINKKIKKNLKLDKINEKNNFSLLIGFNSKNKEKIFIPENGLYQNVLVTGTIGSRKNKFCNVSFIKSVNKI